ncbi:Mlp family lipoprotein (plasmid) [Borreliella yangtzensis]|uniref:tRNA(Met) C34 N-acetyltransferase TmcA n=1 Tax=Borreliella yangtzensis TaxID=683292 RepID=A0ABR6PB65_9SPIR|nr:tRNA(Met) C34 N-acetyltransferase TmcA [Borreliella yangtzensis]
MKIINILFCLFLLMLNGCNSNDNDTLKNNAKQSQSRKKRDLSQEKSQEEKPKSKEELLKEKLTADQKTQLDWLKEAMGNDEKFDKFLENNEDKIKSALEHIKSELDSCNGKDNADEQKTTFKTVVGGFFSGGEIDNFKNGAVSNCDSQ